MSNAAQIVTIKSLRTLYKNGEPAERIEMANCDEHGFDIVVQKGLYVIGDKALYITPDYCLPLTKEGQPNSNAVKMFLDFTIPDGDPKKSKLGKMGRIRAIKFNFQLDPDGTDPVYSIGVMMPLSDIVGIDIVNSENLDELLEITKYEEPETMYSGMSKGTLPSGMYSTDESNIKSMRRTNFPMILTGSLKVDGSSITVYYRNEEQNGIGSRTLEKKLDQTQISGYTDLNGNPVRKHYDKELNIRGWMDNADTFYTEPNAEWIPILTEVDDTFVKIGKPILESLRAYCIDKGLQLALRGELCGTGLKGSGNKNNPHNKLQQQIFFYAIDDYSTGITVKVPLNRFYSICEDLGIQTCPVIFKDKSFETVQDLIAECDAYFKDNLIEGIVVKNEDATFSSKVMNSDYDSKK